MVDHNKLRSRLMEGAIKAVSEHGLEGLTTRSIEQQCKLKDSYIYRYFEDKEDLLKKTFLREDKTFISIIETNFNVMEDETLPFKDRCYALWNPCWQYLVSRSDVCKFYVRYYYSTLFDENVQKEHMAICNNLIKRMTLSISNSNLINTRMVLHHILETMLSYGIKISTGVLENTKTTSDAIFEIVFNFLNITIDSNPDEKNNENESKMSYMEFYSIVQKWK